MSGGRGLGRRTVRHVQHGQRRGRAGQRLSAGVTGSCLNSDDGDTSLGNFGGLGRSAEGTFGGLGGGTDKGYDGNGKQSRKAAHSAAGLGLGAGGSVQKSWTDIQCYFGCPSQVQVCGDLGCDSSPSKSAGDSSGGSLLPPSKGARSTGDPHMRTADNTRYDMQAVGEFTWATVPPGGPAAAPRRLRRSAIGRIHRAGPAAAGARQPTSSADHGGRRATSAATGSPSPSRLTPSTRWVFSVTGLGAAQVPPVGTFTLPHGATVVRTAQQVTISAGGNTLWVATNPYGLNVNASFSAAAQAHVQGLMEPSGGQPGDGRW